MTRVNNTIIKGGGKCMEHCHQLADRQIKIKRHIHSNRVRPSSICIKNQRDPPSDQNGQANGISPNKLFQTQRKIQQ